MATELVNPETCTICHKGSGADHQAAYNELYQEDVIEVTDLKYRFTANPDTTIVTFKMTENGTPISGASVENTAIYWVAFTGTSFEGAERLTLKGKLTYDPATGVTTSTLVEKAEGEDGYIDYTNLSGQNGLVVMYGRDNTMGRLPARVYQANYVFAALLETGAVTRKSPVGIATILAVIGAVLVVGAGFRRK